MQPLNLKERFVRALKGKEIDKVPVCSVTQTATVQLMEISGAKWPQAHYDPEKMATLAIAGHNLAGLEGVRFPFCTTVIAQTLGCGIEEGNIDTHPYQVSSPCSDMKDIENIAIPEDLCESERISTVLKTADIVRDRVGDDVPVIAGMIGPAAAAFYMAGAKNYLMWCIQHPDAIQELMEIGTEVCIEYSNALFEHGVDAVNISDSEAGPDIFPVPMFGSMVLPQYRKLTSRLQGLSVLHICGDATEILDQMAVSGFNGISIEEKVNARYARHIIGDRACLIGNVSPTMTLLSKSPSEIRKEAKQCIEDGVGILAPGCGIEPHTSMENLQAFVAARNDYYQGSV
jgi:[methyl-Co(III) methanol-specific corrinoid protein]:coenzyme M methyltransferase